MPWSNNSGGPWGNGSSGGGGGGGGPRNPWGQGPQRGGGGGGGGNGGGGPQPPDLDELFRQSQERFRQTFGGGGGGGFSKIGLGVAGIALVAGYLALSVYQVEPDENAVVTRFGAYHATKEPGLQFSLWPVDSVEKVPVTRIKRIDIGFRSTGGSGGQRAVPAEGLMLAGDENIIDIQFAVLWRIDDPQKYLFNIVLPEDTVKAVSESSMREIVGKSEAEFIRGRGRQSIMQQVEELIQTTLDEYDSGITVTEVQLDTADPPPAVIDSFRDVQAAQQDQQRLRNEADRYFNEKVAGARGESQQMLEQAEAYRARVVAEAQGEAARFASIYTQYKVSPEVIRERMYLETMERVLGGMEKIILDEGTGGAGQGVVPYLPLNNLTRDRSSE